MHWFFKLIFIAVGNVLALWLINHYVPGFVVSMHPEQLVILALILAVLNFVLKPIFTLILGPIIILTLGLGLLIVNGIIVWLLPTIANHLDILQGSISIQTVPALVWGTIIITVINFVIHLGT